MKTATLCLIMVGLCLSSTVQAGDNKLMESIKNAMQRDVFKEKLSPDISFYFGDQTHASITKSFGNFVSNKKTNAFNKTDEKACQWAFLSALISLQDRAKKEGGNAVVNIVSYYKKHPVSSDIEYECHVGTFVAGVALKGDVVYIGK